MRRFLLILPVLLLAGCSGEGLAALLGAAGTAGGTYLLGTAQADADAAAAWNVKHNMRVDKVVDRCFRHAEENEPEDFDAAMANYKKCLAFDEESQPRILLERLRDRASRAQERRAGEQPK